MLLRISGASLASVELSIVAILRVSAYSSTFDAGEDYHCETISWWIVTAL